MGGQEAPASTGSRHIALIDSAGALSMSLSVFSGVVFGVDGFVSDAGPAHFYFLA